MNDKKTEEEVLTLVSETYKLINFTDVEEPYRENVRQARKKLNKISSMINDSVSQFKPNAVEVEKFRERLSRKDFYDVMQAYRLSRVEPQDEVVAAYEKVKQWIQDNCLFKATEVKTEPIRYLCDNCGWIGTRKEMKNEQDISYNQDCCPKCNDVMFDDGHGYVYCQKV